MKSKLKVKRIVDSFLSKDDVGFYKIEWEESWLPVDAFQHLKYMIEEFWKHKDFGELCKTLKNMKASEEKCKDTDEKEEAPVENEGNTCGNEHEQSCYFCGEHVNPHCLNTHEHEHIRQNCSQVLINLIGERKNDNFMIVQFDESSSAKEDVSKSIAPVTTNNVSSLPFCTSETLPTMTIHHRSSNESGLSCPVCNEKFKLFNEFIVHFETHRKNPRYFFCEECGKQFVSKELFEKHTQLHIDANRRQKSYGNKISSFKSGRKAIRRIIYPRLYQAVDNSNHAPRKDQLIDLSQSPFGALNSSGEYGNNDQSQQVNATNKMFVEMLETNRYRKRVRKEAAEFSPDVLRSARQYIKAVSKRRKVIKRSRLLAQEECKDSNPVVSTLVDGIGVDVELERSEDSLPILSVIEGKQAYSCKVCSKTFFNKFHHREHYNVHSGEMPYECEFCLKRFAQRSGWNRHIKLHHKYDVFAGPLPRSALEKHNEKDTSYSHDQPLLPVTRVTMAEPANFNVHQYIPTEIRPKSGLSVGPDVPQSNPASEAGTGNPITALTRLTYESHTPYPFNYDHIPDTVRCALQTGLTPPSFTAVSGSQPSVLAESTTKEIDSVETTNKKDTSPGKTTAFQCKKVRTMNGDLIFMIRVSEKKDSPSPNKEFAYILDDAGFVESRIFVDDYPGGDWLDFPLDETANDVLRSRVHDYDEQNRRGPKPAHLATNRKQLSSKVDSEDAKKKDVSVCEKVRSFMKATRPMSTKDLVASSLILTTATAGESRTHLAIQKATHGRSFRSGREKRFTCSICERKFLAQAHLNDHMLIHTGELPYKCMFCNRPFRHKSGLNSHHKRHIQRGVFNRPISSKDKVIYPAVSVKQNTPGILLSNLNNARNTDLSTSNQPSDILLPQLSDIQPMITNNNARLCPPSFINANLNSMNSPVVTNNDHAKEPCEKQKRKGRKPKQVRKSATYLNGELVPKMEDNGDAYCIDDETQRNFNEDSYECNFCSLIFPMRTAYLKHVHRMHKASNPSEAGEFNDISSSCEENMFSEYEGTCIKEEVFDDTGENMSNGVVENLFPDVTIKEEVIDEAYEG